MITPSPSPSRHEINVATHEASHAVANLANGCRFDGVALYPSGLSGHVFGLKHGSHCKGRCSIAGIVGERLQNLNSNWGDVLDSCKKDLDQVRSDTTDRAALEWRIKCTADLLSRGWGTVTAVADALIDKRTLTRADVIEIVAAHRTSKMPIQHKFDASSFSPIVRDVFRRDVDADPDLDEVVTEDSDDDDECDCDPESDDYDPECCDDDDESQNYADAADRIDADPEPLLTAATKAALNRTQNAWRNPTSKK